MSLFQNRNSRCEEAVSIRMFEPRYLGSYKVLNAPRIRVGLLGCLLVALATDATAHRLDEYLQATRVAVATNRVDLSIDLTPGVSVADQLLVVIDLDRDGRVSKEEGVAYAQRVLEDIQVGLDGKTVVPRLLETSFPKLAEIRSGHGVIRIKATASVGPLAAGPHALGLTNAHLPAISVYLVNALVPKDPAIKIGQQTRDELQKEYRLEFGVSAPAAVAQPVGRTFEAGAARAEN